MKSFREFIAESHTIQLVHPTALSGRGIALLSKDGVHTLHIGNHEGPHIGNVELNTNGDHKITFFNAMHNRYSKTILKNINGVK